MTFKPFLDATLAIQIHMLVAIAALVIGALILWRTKGSPRHRVWGKIWVLLMVIVSLSSMFISEIRLWGSFSPIHLISIFVLVSLPLAIVAARQGNIARHRIIMQGTYAGGLIVAGGLTFLPGRLNFQIFFGQSASLDTGAERVTGLLAAVATAVCLAFLVRKLRPRSPEKSWPKIAAERKLT